MSRNFLCILLQKLIPIALLFLSGFPEFVQASEYPQKPINDLPVSNQLRNSPSPYLSIHGEDPVAWQTWSPATFELARKQNKLLFVSIGYFSCHWCHVMQVESYRNAEIAASINQNYIPVKVDRELEVALDAELIAYAQRTLGASGWPLNVFITPEGYPLYATLYQPPDRFGGILSALSSEWQKNSSSLKAIAQKAGEAAPEIKKEKPNAALALKYRKQLVHETLAQADVLSGGINTPRKFPVTPQLIVLLDIEARQHDAKLAEWLRLTLDQMARGGLRDHVAGGFFRYTTDPDWHRPHFEKMLYDNAQLATLYLRAAKVFKHPAYRDIAIETLDFMLNEMRIGGAFVTSLSALDEQGREGGAYLWTEDQLKSALAPDEFVLVHKIWGMKVAAETALGHLPVYIETPTAAEQKVLKEINRKLLQIRQKRSTPKDTKLLAGLNGLALVAFSEASAEALRYRQAAKELRNFVVEKLWQNGELHKGISRQQLLGHGDLESYAFIITGLQAYAQHSGNAADAKLSAQMAKIAWQKFHTSHGFLLEQKSELAKPYYQTVVEDSPLPSPSSLLVEASLRTGDVELREKARNALSFGEVLQRQGLFWFANQVSALNRLFESKPKR
jgi:hypothetical protein